MIKISKLSTEELVESEFQICKDITFISEEQISKANWLAAYDLVKDVDEKDIHYVAFSKQFNRKIWSGDRQLVRGLKKKGFENFILTDELFSIREGLKRRRK